MNVPKCCGEEMKIREETFLYFEAECKKCGDVVYIKKDKAKKPVMLDD